VEKEGGGGGGGGGCGRTVNKFCSALRPKSVKPFLLEFSTYALIATLNRKKSVTLLVLVVNEVIESYVTD
jgi:hypothetical protein